MNECVEKAGTQMYRWPDELETATPPPPLRGDFILTYTIYSDVLSYVNISTKSSTETDAAKNSEDGNLELAYGLFYPAVNAEGVSNHNSL